MPRGNKSKSRSRAKRHHACAVTQEPKRAEPEAEKETASRSGSPIFLTASQEDLSAISPDIFDVDTLCSNVGAEGSDTGAEDCADTEAHSDACGLAESMVPSRKDPLTKKASMLMDFMLEKFKMKEPFTEADMLKVINRKYKVHFHEILGRIMVRLELVFGLELKEIDPNAHLYKLVGKLGLSTEGSLSGDGGLPRTGLLMTLLAVIFMKGNCATEEEVWEFLHTVGIYSGRRHIIFGEPRKFITVDLVQEGYLVYRQKPHSNPPIYEFLWGPRAHAETTKMKVLEVLAKINNTVPSAFPTLYEEALNDEMNRAGRRSATTTRASTRFPAKCTSHSSSHM